MTPPIHLFGVIPTRRLQLAHFRGSLLMLDELLPGSPLVGQLRSEPSEGHDRAA